MRYQYPHFRLALFAKAPQLGRVKTRLAADLGNIAALQCYRRMLLHSLKMATAHSLAPLDLWCTPTCHQRLFRAYQRRFSLTLQQQQGPSLGDRMEGACQTTLRQANGIVLLGSDCPIMNTAYLQQALRHLQRGAEVVIGPAEDGGYVLLGLRRVYPALFRDMPWGGAQVLALTQERLRRLGVPWVELPTLWDVDRAVDLKRVPRFGFSR